METFGHIFHNQREYFVNYLILASWLQALFRIGIKLFSPALDTKDLIHLREDVLIKNTLTTLILMNYLGSLIDTLPELHLAHLLINLLNNPSNLHQHLLEGRCLSPLIQFVCIQHGFILFVASPLQFIYHHNIFLVVFGVLTALALRVSLTF